MFCYLANCKDPGVPEKGARTGNNFEHGQSVTFLCKKGYTLIGSKSADCRNGVWSSSLPQCKLTWNEYHVFRQLLYYQIKALQFIYRYLPASLALSVYPLLVDVSKNFDISGSQSRQA